MHVITGLCSVTFRHKTPTQIIKLAKKAKLSAIEWGGDVHVPCGDLNNAEKIGKLTRKNGIKTLSYGSYFKCLPEEDFLVVSETAKALGAKIIRIWAGNKDAEKYTKNETNELVKRIQKYAEIAAKNKQIIAFEFHNDSFNNSATNSLKLLQEVNRNNVKTYFQPMYWNDYPVIFSKEVTNRDNCKLLANNAICAHLYNWDKTVRNDLDKAIYENAEYLSFLPNVQVAYIEFVKNNSVKQFYEDAQALKKIVNVGTARYNKRASIKFDYPSEEEIFECLKKYGQDVDFIDNSEESFVDTSKTVTTNEKTIRAIAEKYRKDGRIILTKKLYERYYITGNRTDFESLYYARRERAAIFTIMVRFYHDDSYIPDVINEVKDILDEWCWTVPAHLLGNPFIKENHVDTKWVDLGASEAGFCIAEIANILKDKLPKDLIEEMNAAVKDRIIDAFDKPYWWQRKFPTLNWSGVVPGACGCCAIYILKDNRELAHFLSLVFIPLTNLIKSFGDDGSWREGVSYWEFAINYVIMFADLLYKKTNGHLNLFARPDYQKAFNFGLRCTFANNNYFCFADGDHYGRGMLELYDRLRKYIPSFPNAPARDRNGQMINKFILQSFGGHSQIIFRRLFWRDNTPLKDQDLKPIDYFPDGEIFIGRSKSGLGIAAKAGTNNDDSHNHNDVGSFEVFKNSEFLLVDLDRGEYNSKYFDFKTRFNIFPTGSNAHSVPIIDNVLQNEGLNATAENVRQKNNIFSFDYQRCYGALNGLEKLNRRIKFDGDNNVVYLNDSIKFNNGRHKYCGRFITLHKPVIKGQSVVIRAGSEECVILSKCEKIKISKNYFPAYDEPHNPILVYAIDFISRFEKESNFNFRIKVK